MKRRPAFTLLLALLFSSLALTLTGYVLRQTVAADIPQLQEGPALSVPLTLLRDKSILETALPEDQETLSKPGTVTVPTEKNEESTGENDTAQDEEKDTSPDHTKIPEIDEIVIPEDTTTETEGGGTAQTEEKTLGPVDASYFSDALFIGDSRTVGLSQYGRLEGADYFADTGMTVFNLFEQKVSDENFGRQDLRTLLQSKQYGKIYLMLGINEIGYPFETLIPQYQQVVDEIRALQPDALLILCANLHVTRDAAAATPRLEVSNIQRLDDSIAAMADGQTIFFLDENPIFCDEAGYLKKELTGDGVHPYATGYETWAQWYLENGIK